MPLSSIYRNSHSKISLQYLHMRTVSVFFVYVQLSYTDEGLGVTLRRDVTKSQMLSGAIQTDADVNRGATYSVGCLSFGGFHK